MKILVLGSTGYVGGRLIPRLLEGGHKVRCLVRDGRKAAGRPWGGSVEIFEGDVLDPDSLQPAMKDIDVVYYLIHSMAAGLSHFEELDRRAAENTAGAATRANVGQIIYLGGLGRGDDPLSSHLRSRHEVGDVLKTGTVPVTEFRAAVIVGSGSLSFEMIHHLVNRLPVMICPRWVYTRTQPIGIADVLKYLTGALSTPACSGQTVDIGGPDIMSYGDMMMKVAQLLGLRRKLIPVPLLTPRLSSYWINLVTPLRTSTAKALIDSLRHETVCENDRAGELFDIAPDTFEESALRALGRYKDHQIETIWTDASTSPSVFSDIDQSHLRIDRRELLIKATPRTVFDVVSSIGGENGWYHADWLWKLRGFIDKQFGGVGLRRGRRHPTSLRAGDSLDFWRVAELDVGRRLLLRAEMKVWGQAWLEFEVEPRNASQSLLRQTARYYPKGLWGHLYWYLVYPIHVYVFRGLIKTVARKAERIFTDAPGDIIHPRV
ncbi:MAG: SDR family oxidoreductase [Candidatus Zixiibacteriota bacterium]|nr:MAG: SDR family oxidoreductase [candidate division Zixibacteria bacterium]